jgi:cell envelope opacity-associated protein A
MKKCWYYDCSITLEENKRAAEKKIKGKQAAKKEKTKAETEKKQETAQTPPKKENPAEVHKGTTAQLPPKEKAGMCIICNAFLFCEPCNMAGVRPGQVEFIYDSGAVSGVMGE